jgi:putative SOS response-associated peptidase YedK
MCGRYSYFGPLDILKERITFTIHDTEPTASYNIAPTQSVPALLRINGQTVLKHLRWGLVPFWAKDPSMGAKMINARMETLSEKPSFKNAFKKRRCLILSNGYYEWTGEKGNKQPYFITIDSNEPFAFAGLWETWQDKKNPDTPLLESCTIVTTQAASNIAHLHHRMPVILNSKLYEAWLDPELEDFVESNRILKVGMVHDFRYYPVSKKVNSVRNNDPSLVETV